MGHEKLRGKSRDDVLAAGGLVERAGGGSPHIVVVHRTRYRDSAGGAGDWVLPKGKVKAGESLEQAALREVREETGCDARIVGPCATSEYVVGDRPKVVAFFRMTCTGEGPVRDVDEVAEVVWLTPAEALARLTYDSERAVVRSAYPDLVPARSGGG